MDTDALTLVPVPVPLGLGIIIAPLVANLRALYLSFFPWALAT